VLKRYGEKALKESVELTSSRLPAMTTGRQAGA
jgi:hypothetical protein